MGRPRQPGTVFQRASDERWVAQLRRFDPATGTTKVVRRYATSKRGAEDLLRQLRSGTEQPTRRQVNRGMTVAAWATYWAESSLPVQGLKPSTVTLYQGVVASTVVPTLGAVLLSEFTPSEAEAWLARLAAVTRTPKPKSEDERPKPIPLSASRQRTAFNALSKALDTAVRDGLVETNPLHKVKRPTPRQAAVPVADADQVDTLLLPACDGWDLGPLVTFVALTGCRVGEAMALEWTDVDLEAGTATLRRSAVGADSTKGGHARAVPLLPELVAVLRAHRRTQRQLRLALGSGWPATGLVFTSAVGTPLDYANTRRRVAKKLDALGMPSARPFHSLRHGLAARLLRREVPLPVVSALLGHSSIRVTADVYGHVAPAMHADSLARAMGR